MYLLNNGHLKSYSLEQRELNLELWITWFANNPWNFHIEISALSNVHMNSFGHFSFWKQNIQSRNVLGTKRKKITLVETMLRET